MATLLGVGAVFVLTLAVLYGTANARQRRILRAYVRNAISRTPR